MTMLSGQCRVFSRNVVQGGKLLLWGEKSINEKNIQKTSKICYCLEGEFKIWGESPPLKALKKSLGQCSLNSSHSYQSMMAYTRDKKPAKHNLSPSLFAKHQLCCSYVGSFVCSSSIGQQHGCNDIVMVDATAKQHKRDASCAVAPPNYVMRKSLHVRILLLTFRRLCTYSQRHTLYSPPSSLCFYCYSVIFTKQLLSAVGESATCHDYGGREVQRLTSIICHPSSQPHPPSSSQAPPLSLELRGRGSSDNFTSALEKT